MDLLADMLANMFKSDAITFHRRLGVLRCFRPDNPTGTPPQVGQASTKPVQSAKSKTPAEKHRAVELHMQHCKLIFSLDCVVGLCRSYFCASRCFFASATP